MVANNGLIVNCWFCSGNSAGIYSAAATNVLNLCAVVWILGRLVCMSLQSAIYNHGEAEDCFISEQSWALTYCLRLYLLCYFSAFVSILLYCLCFCWLFFILRVFIVFYFVFLLVIFMNAVICRPSNPLRRGHSRAIIVCSLSSVAGAKERWKEHHLLLCHYKWWKCCKLCVFMYVLERDIKRVLCPGEVKWCFIERIKYSLLLHFW